MHIIRLYTTGCLHSFFLYEIMLLAYAVIVGVLLISSWRDKKDDVGIQDVRVPPAASRTSTRLTMKCDASDIKTSLEKTGLISRQVWHALSKKRERACNRGEKEQMKEESMEMKDFLRPDRGVMGGNNHEQMMVVLLNIELTCCFSQFVS